jgi:hypothetical protein
MICLRSLERWNRGFEFHSRHLCMYCVHLLYVCIVLCVGNGLATGWSPVQWVLPTAYRIKKLKNRPRSNKGPYSRNNNNNNNVIFNITEGPAVAQRLDAGFPPRRPGFEYGQHVGFVVDKPALGQVFSEYFGFPCQSFHRFLYYHNHPGLTH